LQATNTQASVTFATNAATAFTTVSSNVSARSVNGVAYSDPNDIDSFPVVNTLKVGPSTEAVQRLLPIGERLITVKDDSVYALDETFSAQIYDTALSCSLPNSFARVNNQWIGLFTRGFCALNTTQATAIGRPIDREVTSQYNQFLYDELYTNFASAAAIDASGNYVCTLNTRTFVYNVIANAWSEWQINSVAPDEDFESGDYFNYVNSGMRFIGAFGDTFVTNQPAVRGAWRQRDWRGRGSGIPIATDWYHDYSDMQWYYAATIGSDLTTITISSAESTVNPTSVPPFTRTPPQGATVAPSAAEADSRWVMFLEQAPYSGYFQCTVSVAVPGVSSSSMTVTVSDALPEQFIAGAAFVTLFSPILCRVQYAPTVVPGQNAAFMENVVTIERSMPGYIVSRYFGRNDVGNADVLPIGSYEEDQGVCRAVDLPELVSGVTGTGGVMAYNQIVRFEVPSDRAANQNLGIELWECNAWQPLAIKAVVIDYRPEENTKAVK
jgi:hypothetical protein